jgi:hypothetical protein
MSVSLPLATPSLRKPLRAKSPVDSRAEDVAAADGADVARDRRRRSDGWIDGLSRVDRGRPVVVGCQSVAACSQHKKRKKENRRSRGEPHGLLLRRDCLILAVSGLPSKARLRKLTRTREVRPVQSVLLPNRGRTAPWLDDLSI